MPTGKPSGKVNKKTRGQSSDHRRARKSSAGKPGTSGLQRAVFALGEAIRSTRRSILVLWLVAVVVLAGLVYWSLAAKRPVTPRTDAASRALPQSKSPGKALERPVQSKDPHPAKPDTSPIETAKATPHPSPGSAPPPSAAADHPQPAPAPAIPSQPSLPPLARVAIVIDDFGDNLEIAKAFAELPIPVTFSILPQQKYSTAIAQLAHERSREVMLHLPMEPRNYPNKKPGAGALLLSMSDEKMGQAVQTALDTSPFFSGLNNHMGSRFTENASAMKVVLAEVQRRGLYFLDSSTSPRSAAYATAREMQIPCGRRDIFLDHAPGEAAVRSQIRLLLRRARIVGSATAIGHAREATLRALTEGLNGFSQERVAVVPASDLMARF
jgi:uncharacterized protein